MFPNIIIKVVGLRLFDEINIFTFTFTLHLHVYQHVSCLLRIQQFPVNKSNLGLIHLLGKCIHVHAFLTFKLSAHTNSETPSHDIKQWTLWRDVAAWAISSFSRAAKVFSSQQKILLNLIQNAFETANSDESTKQKSIKSFAGGYSTKTKAPQKAIKEFVSHFCYISQTNIASIVSF